jgi:hypothetical protein
MDELDEFEQLLTKEIKSINAKSDISPTELSNAKNALCCMKEISIIKAMKNSEGKESFDVDASYAMKPYMYDMSRGEIDRTRIDRYPNHGSTNTYRNYETMRSGHSVEDRIIESLEKVMDDVKGEYEHQIVMDWINRVREGR